MVSYKSALKNKIFLEEISKDVQMKFKFTNILKNTLTNFKHLIQCRYYEMHEYSGEHSITKM